VKHALFFQLVQRLALKAELDTPYIGFAIPDRRAVFTLDTPSPSLVGFICRRSDAFLTVFTLDTPSLSLVEGLRPGNGLKIWAALSSLRTLESPVHSSLVRLHSALPYQDITDEH
jgi:hypothetical protein